MAPRSRLWSLRAGLAVALAVSVFAQPAPAPAAPGAPAGRLVFRLGGDMDSMDPHKMRAVNSYQLAVAMHDRVVSVAPDGSITPMLASSWDVTASGGTFKIRDDVTCADGERLTPTVIANSLKRLADPNTKAPYAVRTFGGNVPELIADDANWTLTIKLAKPYSDLMLGLAMPWSSVICSAAHKDEDNLTLKTYGSGPYTLVEAKRGDSYTLKVRPDYKWGGAGATTAVDGLPAEIVFRAIDNDTTAANLILAGDVDFGVVSGQDRARLERDTSLNQTNVPAFGSIFLAMNQNSGRIGADATVRKAVYTAVDAASFLQAAAFGQGSVAYSVTTPSADCYEPETERIVPRYDIDGARKILEADGWSRGSDGKYSKNGQALALTLAGYEGQAAGPEYLLEALEDLGATVKLVRPDFRGYGDVLFGSGDWDVTPFPFGPPMPSPNTASAFVSGPTPPGGSNFAYLNNTKFEQARDAALAIVGPDRCAKWQEAQRALVETHDIKPLYAPEFIIFAKRNVTVKMLVGSVVDPLGLRRGN